MAVVGVGIILIYILLAVIGFVITVAVLRWAFGINKIVELLTDISNSLRLRKVTSPPAGTPPEHTAQIKTTERSRSYGISQSELSAGDWIEDSDGERFQVVDFRGKDLIVKRKDGEPTRISPPFNFRKA